MRPFLPSERNASTFVQSTLRAVAAFGRGEKVIDDKEAQAILKAATTPTALTTSGVPVGTALAIMPQLLGPASAGSNLVRLAAHADFYRYGALAVPKLVASGTGMVFVLEGAPIPFFQFALSDSDLSPKKIALGAAFTRQAWENTQAEAFMTSVLTANASLAFESILFDATAASATRPAGLRNGIAAMTADAGSGEAAMLADLANLAGICAAVGGANLAYVASPKQFVKIMLKKPSDFPFPVFCSSALADRQVACIALPALAIAGYGEPKISISKQTLVVMQDSAPQQIGSVGTPNTVAAPTFNAFGQDGVVLRILVDMDWVLRDAAGFAWTQSTNW